jgi:hypothetical protein
MFNEWRGSKDLLHGIKLFVILHCRIITPAHLMNFFNFQPGPAGASAPTGELGRIRPETCPWRKMADAPQNRKSLKC